VAWRDFGLEGAAQIDGPLPFTLAVNGFGLIVGGWGSQDRYPRILADVNGDGRADVVGFGVAGTWVALARPSGGYEAASLAIGNFGEVIGGWTTQDRFPRTMADVNGDGRADVVGFGLAGVWVALADGAGGFATPALALGAFGEVAGGWARQERYPRMLADVNGDGRADVVGFGVAGVWVAQGTVAGTFGAPYQALGAFGEVAGGWTGQDRFPRLLADVNGDGRADVVGFGLGGVWVATANSTGRFDAPQLLLGAFGEVAGGWTSQDLFPRTVADVNGDGRADVVGFGRAGVWVALANGSGGFDAPRLAIGAFGAEAGGWSSQDRFPRMLADVNGDGWAEVIGFGNAGVYVESVFGFA
jgi:hypothetical protein